MPNIRNTPITDGQGLEHWALPSCTLSRGSPNFQADQNRVLAGYDLNYLGLHAADLHAPQLLKDVGASVARVRGVLLAAPAYVVRQQRSVGVQVVGFERGAQSRCELFGAATGVRLCHSGFLTCQVCHGQYGTCSASVWWGSGRFRGKSVFGPEDADQLTVRGGDQHTVHVLF